MNFDSERDFTRFLNRNRLISLFQPIASAQDLKVVGYKALIRGPSNSPCHSPQLLFSLAERYGLGLDVELRSVFNHVESHKRQRLDGTLFLNFSTRSLASSRFDKQDLNSRLQSFGLRSQDVVIEITKQYPMDDFIPMISILDELREMGFQIAIDDLGAGYSSFRQRSEIRPDYVKIDGHFIQNIHEDPVKRQYVRSICEIANNINSRVIAEGIETEDELDTVRTMDVDLLQGYLLARPQKKPARRISQRLKQFHQQTPLSVNEQRVRLLSKQTLTVPPSIKVSTLAAIFYRDHSLRIVVVIKGDKPLGVVTRNSLQQLFASQYGRDLYGRKPVTLIMNEEVITVNENTRIDRLSNQITAEYETLPDEYFVIVDQQERYSGVGSLIDLLRAVTEFRITAARHANPLTQLPGNLRINQQVDNLLNAKEPFVLAYCDVDNFKPFNDTYGYARGDDVIREIGQLLLKSAHSNEDFVGHIGGDDFILVFRSVDWESRCRRVLKTFEEEAPRYYDDNHRGSGGISAVDRRGQEQFYPIISISVGAIQVSSDVFTSHKEIASISSEVKKQAKKIAGNSLFVDRRDYRSSTSPDLPETPSSSNVIQINPER
jgi:diguanylate cyclase (GGDEF)-like protein